MGRTRPMALSTWMRMKRSSLGMTQWEFANRIGVDQSHISRIESGQGSVTMRTFTKIAKAFKLSMGELLKQVEEV